MNKNLIKATSALMISGVLIGNMGNISFADINLNSKDIYGIVSMQSEFGDKVTSGYIYKKEISSEASGDNQLLYYGIPMLNGINKNEDGISDVEEFLNWLNKSNPTLAKEFNDKKVGTEDFNNTWEKVAKLHENEFAKSQQQFIFETRVTPAIEYFKSEYNIDFTKDRGVEELLFSIVNNLGEYSTLNIIDKAIHNDNLSSDSTSKDIISSIQKYRAEYISNSSSNDAIRDAGIKSVSNETNKYLELVNEDSLTTLIENNINITENTKTAEEIKSNNSISKPKNFFTKILSLFNF